MQFYGCVDLEVSLNNQYNWQLEKVDIDKLTIHLFSIIVIYIKFVDLLAHVTLESLKDKWHVVKNNWRIFTV